MPLVLLILRSRREPTGEAREAEGLNPGLACWDC